MATYTTYTDGSAIATTVGAGAYASTPARVILEGTFDASRRNLVAGDIVPLVNVPAGMLVEQVGYTIVTPEATAAQTFNVGDGNVANGYVPAASSSAAAGTRGVGSGTLVVAAGTFYPAGGTINLSVPATMVCTTFKVRVFVIGTIIG